MSGPSHIDDSESRVDLVRRLQQQSQLEQQQIESMTTAELHAELQRIAVAAEVERAKEATEAVGSGTRLSHERREDIQGQAGAQDLAGHGNSVDGSHRATEAVDAAHKQQARGESWDQFQSAEGTPVPPGVEETAQGESRREDARQEGQDRVRARELQNQMAVQNRMIKG